MNIVKTGTTLRIFDKSVESMTELPPGAYQVEFTKMTGFFLKEINAPEVKVEKIYGKSPMLVEKVMSTYTNHQEKNLGVILSGSKGIGKSMFAKMLSEKAISIGIPVLFVNSYFEGLPGFFKDITQDVVVVFDEFDKNFYDNSTETNDASAVQDQLLSMFDGVYDGHRLFVITCNDIGKLSSFYINRPGRFKYHLRFSYPGAEEVREYIEDRIGKDHDDIDKIVDFTRMIPLSYDCLDAISSEILDGETFVSAMDILNIVNVGELIHYAVEFVCKTNEEVIRTVIEPSFELDMFERYGSSDKRFYSNVYLSIAGLVGMPKIGSVRFNVEDIRNAVKTDDNGRIHIPADKFKFTRMDNDFEGSERSIVEGIEPMEIVLIPRRNDENISFGRFLKTT